MKHKLLIIFGVLLLPVLAMAQSSLSMNFNPTMAELNSMSTASFDPFMPDTQPILTRLTISNSGDAVKIDLKVRVFWNNNFLVESTFESSNPIDEVPVILTNRDLITKLSSNSFRKKGLGSISLDAVINANPILKSAVLAGYFPDGDLQIRTWIRDWIAEDNWTDLPIYDTGYQEFTIRIRNAGYIHLISPGVPVGGNPPQLSGAPLSFFWNALETGINQYRLIIREYAPIYPPTLQTVEKTGNLFFDSATNLPGMTVNSGFSNFLPFTQGNYYAWKITTSLSNEHNTGNSNNTLNNTLNSNWFVFRYASESEANNSISEFQARLNLLNNVQLLNYYTLGYVPLGVIIYEGRTYSGQDAYNLIDSLMGQDIDVQLKD